VQHAGRLFSGYAEKPSMTIGAVGPITPVANMVQTLATQQLQASGGKNLFEQPAANGI
jgi:hypothetical protein